MLYSKQRSKDTKVYPTVQFYIVFRRYIEWDGGVDEDSTPIIDTRYQNIFRLTAGKSLL